MIFFEENPSFCSPIYKITSGHDSSSAKNDGVDFDNHLMYVFKSNMYLTNWLQSVIDVYYIEYITYVYIGKIMRHTNRV